MNLETLEIIVTLLAIWVVFGLAVDFVFASLLCLCYVACVIVVLVFLNMFNDY